MSAECGKLLEIQDSGPRMAGEAQNNSQQDVIAEEYMSSLADLTVNSKPLINMLTMLAEENVESAPVIVKVIEKHLSQVLNLTFKFSFYIQ